MTTHQLAILKLVAAGYTNKEVAEEMGMAASTVKQHLYLISMRLGIGGRVRLAHWYWNNYERTEQGVDGGEVEWRPSRLR